MRIFQEPPQSGLELMKRDSDLLHAAASGESDIIVRFYEWEVPTISLGFHQKEALLDTRALEQAEVPWVRRPTGGAAVLHSEELTYAVIVPAITEGNSAAHIHELIGRAITKGLVDLGIPAQLEARGEVLSSLPSRTSCFARTSRWEVTAGGRKLVGSAQRKLGSAILQHGSILTDDDHLRIVDFLALKSAEDREIMRGKLAVKSTSIRQELNKSIPIDRIRQAMEASFRQTLSGSLEEVQRQQAEVSR